MSLLFWKKKHTGEVIHPDCYKKLPAAHRSFWDSTSESPTHQVSDDSGLLTGLMLGAMGGSILSGAAMGSFDSEPLPASTNDTPPTEFGGGTGDGAGASGSWEPDNSQPDTSSSDNGSSDYSTADSSSSSDSMSTSSDY